MAKKKTNSLIEGFTNQVGSAVRGFFARSSENQSYEIQRGGTPSVERAGLPYNLVSQYGYDSLAQHLQVDQDLQTRYSDYEEMDEYPELSTALDIYADDTTIPDMESGKSIWVTSEQQSIAKELDNMLHSQVMVENDLWGNARTIAKYGNCFGEALVSEQGVIGLNYLPPPTIRRVEGPRGELLGFIQDTRGEFNLNLEDFYKLAKQRGTAAERARPPGQLTVFEDWELIHWRLRGKHLRSVYGHSVIDPARWIWKRLALLEDALLIYKLERAPARYAFYIDVGDLDQERGLAFVNRVKNQFVKKKFVNPATGKIDMRHNPLAHDEDFFVPTRQGKDSTRIEVLQGPDYAETDTVEYHRDKLVAALKVPKLYMGYGGESTRTALSSEDIRFARTVMRIQREMQQGYRQLCRIHLVAKGMSAEEVDANNYEVRMSAPSAIMELAKLEVMSATADLAQRLGEYMGTKFILTNLFKYTEEQAAKLMDERSQEMIDKAKIEGRSQQIIQQATMPPAGGAPQFASQETGSDPLLERRLSRVVRSELKDWEKRFEGTSKSSKWQMEDRLARVLANDPGLKRQMKSIEGLLADVRRHIRG
jgi:hypothetical protein